MVDSYDKRPSGIVCGVSRRAGAVAGTSVFLSKKIANCGFKTITVAKDCLKQPLKCIVPTKDKKSSSISQDPAIKSTNAQETDRKKAAKAIIASLESKLGVAQQQLEKAQSKAEKTQAELASQLKKLEVEKKSLISQLQNTHETEAEAVKVDKEGEQMERVQTSILNEQEKEEEGKVESEAAQKSNKRKSKEKVVEPVLAQSEEMDTETEEQVSNVAIEANQALLKTSTGQEVVETLVSEPGSQEQVIEQAPEAINKMLASAVVTEKDVRTADFDNETERILFARALADISSQDANVRVDGVKAMACITHELTIRALTARLVCESSILVRRECIKALAAMEMAESIPAVEHSLTDEAGSVRLAAVWGLYHLAGAKSAPALIRMLADNDEEVRRRAVTCLGWLGNKELAVELLPLLDDNSISVRRAVIEAMTNLRSRQVVSTLIERLNDPVESIRKLVLRAIETITGKKMSKFFPKDEKEFERLIVRWQQWRKEQLLE